MEKVNGIKYSYAWLDRHPDVRAVVDEPRSSGITPIVSGLSVPLAHFGIAYPIG